MKVVRDLDKRRLCQKIEALTKVLTKQTWRMDPKLKDSEAMT